MGIRCSTRDTYYTQLYPRRKHAPGCICAGQENTKRVIDPNEIDTDDLFDHILTPHKSRRGGKKGSGPGKPHGEYEKKTGISGMADIYALGLHDQPNQVINDRLSLQDILINKYTVHNVDIGNRDLGKRVIYARPISYMGPPYRILRFAIFSGGEDNLRMHIFDLELASDREYWDMFVQLFVLDPAAGARRQKYRTRFQRVLICGIWTAHPSNMKSNGKWRCISHQHAVCPLPKQQICTNDIDLAD